MKRLLVLFGLVFLLLTAGSLNAYYYGQNKVNSTHTRWSQIETMHFDIYFPAGNDNFGRLAALMAEETYYYLKSDFQFPAMSRIPIIFYSSQMEFQTTNIIYPLLPEGVGGFTESLKNRVVIPFDGSYAKLEQTLTHELTHAYINALDAGSPGSFFYLKSFNFPFWFSEGLPEFQAMGGSDINNNAFILDLVLNDRIRSLTEISGYSAYRLGESFLVFLNKRYGRDKVMDFFYSLRASSNLDRASKKVFGMEFRDLESRWRNQLKRDYFPFIQSHTIPHEYSDRKTTHRDDGSYFNLAPRFSPDGQKYVYFSNRDGRFSIWTGGLFETSPNRKLLTGEATGSMEEFHYLRSNLAWFPDSKRFAYAAKTSDGDKIYIADYDKAKIIKEFSLPPLRVIYELDISADGENCVFSAQQNMQSDIYLYNFTDKKLTQLTNDSYSDAQPRFSPDGKHVAFTSDRTRIKETFRKGFFSDLKTNLYTINLDSNELNQVTFDEFNNYHPVWDSTGTRLFFISEQDSIPNLEVVDLKSSQRAKVTKTLSGIYSFDFNSNQSSMVYSCYFDGGWDIYLKTEPLDSLQFSDTVSPQVIAPSDNLLEKINLSHLDYYGRRRLKKPVTDGGPRFINQNATVFDFHPELDSIKIERDYSWDDRPDSVSVIPAIKPYKVKFSLDRFWGGFAYSSSVGTIGSLELGLSDIMGNHGIGINLGISGKIKDSNILLTYLYLPKRIDYGIGVYNIFDEVIYQRIKIGLDDFYRERQRETGLYFLTRYPLNKFFRLDFENQIYSWEYHWDSWIWAENGVEGHWENDSYLINNVLYDQPSKTDLIYAPAVTLVHDNTLYGPTGPLLGWRAFVTLRKSFALHKNDYHTAYMDLRSYTLFSKRYALALRLVGGGSGGKQPQNFELNGYYGVRGYEGEEVFGKGFGAIAQVMIQGVAFVLNLLLKERIHHHRADSGVFQAADGIYFFG
ncbi:MAG: hypothetical protein R6V77_01325 [Candidatus Cloacimonadaceae bacterium]